jgi:hypothetical protein
MDLIEHYKAVRLRLWNPPNARDDDGIDLKRRPHEVTVIKHRLPPKPRPRLLSFPPLPQPIVQPELAAHPTMQEIIEAVAAAFMVSVTDIRSKRRNAHFVRPRQIAMALAKRLTLQSYPGIGRNMGGRDHTTCIFAVKKPAIAALLAAVEAEMGDSLDPVAWAQAIRRIVP